jgi:hypothetical protein
MERHHIKKHCEVEFTECKKPCKKDKKKCEKKCEKKCKSSSSSECEKQCVPKVVYQACICGGVASLSLTATVTTPNNDQPPTFNCPAQIGQRIYINFTVTNTGNVKIKSPVYTYDGFTGINKVTCKSLHPGESKTITVHHKISNCQCQPGNNISISSNAYTNFHKNCLILVSPALGIQINQA